MLTLKKVSTYTRVFGLYILRKTVDVFCEREVRALNRGKEGAFYNRRVLIDRLVNFGDKVYRRQGRLVHDAQGDFYSEVIANGGISGTREGNRRRLQAKEWDGGM